MVAGVKESQPTEGSTQNRRERVIESICHASPNGSFEPGRRAEIYWPGMQLLSLNEILRIDHRQLHAYRGVCHEAVKNAAWLLAGRSHGLKFETPVQLTVIRTGVRLVDIDGLYASFKFIIDGFRYCGVLADDNPSHVARMLHEQSTGKPMIGIRIEPIES